MRDIRELHCSDDFRATNFGLMVEMKELPQGGATRSEYYEITKDGFTFLVMGYTGEKAAKFKEMFIEALSEVITEDNKSVTDQIKIVEEIKDIEINMLNKYLNNMERNLKLTVKNIK